MQPLPINTLFAQLNIRCAEDADLIAMEWDGEYSHFRRLFADTYQQAELGLAKIWVAELDHTGLIGQLEPWSRPRSKALVTRSNKPRIVRGM